LRDYYNKIQEVKLFQQTGKIPLGCNALFITLIPRRKILWLNDFRPISLVGSICKMITKMLGNRMKTILPKVIYSNQLVFIKGKGLFDSILVANEVVDDL